jgi:hypothetical protein
MKHCVLCQTERAYYNYRGYTAPDYCKDCKKDDMYAFSGNVCVVCKLKNACFNYVDQTKMKYCGTCKLDDMVNIKDIKRNCIICCKTRAFFSLI